MPEPTQKPGRPENVIALDVKLMPVDHSDQPVSANYTNVMAAQGIAYLDFGFIEPTVLGTLARGAQAGEKVPDRVAGKLVVRVGVGLDVLVRLHQQLQQVLVGLKGRREAKQ